MERLSFFGLVITAILVTLLLCSEACKAEEVEMELKVSNGLTEREYHLSDPNATFMQCVFQAPIIATRWISENIGEQWIILRISCGPPRRSL
jgi:hypothetical protein